MKKRRKKTEEMDEEMEENLKKFPERDKKKWGEEKIDKRKIYEEMKKW